MKRFKPSLATLLLCSVVGAVQFGIPKMDAVVSREYRGENGIDIRGVGVCSFDSQISCWNMDGKPDPILTKAVSDFYEPNEISFRIGKKNRLLVVKKTIPASSFFQMQDARGQFVNSAESRRRAAPLRGDGCPLNREIRTPRSWVTSPICPPGRAS